MKGVNVTETVLWDFGRVFVVITTPGEAMVIVLPYLVALRLQESVASESCRLLSTMQAVLLTSPHTCWTRVCSRVSRPSHGLDLAPSDFHLFGNLKIKLRIQRFTSADVVKSEAQK